MDLQYRKAIRGHREWQWARSARAHWRMIPETVSSMPNVDWTDFLMDKRESAAIPTLRSEDAQVFFEVGDEVRFCTPDGSTRTGTVEKLNPKRARVRCGAGGWAVPYAGLQHLCASTATERRSRAAR